MRLLKLPVFIALLTVVFFFTVTTAFSDVIPMRITNNGNDIAGMVYLGSDSRYVESFNGLGLAVFIDGLDPIITMTMPGYGFVSTFPYEHQMEILEVNSDHYNFYNFWGDIDSLGRVVTLDGTVHYTSRSYGGRSDPPQYWPHATGLNYHSLDLNIWLWSPDNTNRNISLTAYRVSETGTLLSLTPGIILLAGYSLLSRWRRPAV